MIEAAAYQVYPQVDLRDRTNTTTAVDGAPRSAEGGLSLR